MKLDPKKAKEKKEFWENLRLTKEKERDDMIKEIEKKYASKSKRN